MRRKEQKLAYAVESMISKIKDVSLESKDDINDIRISFESLSNEQKVLVKNIYVLDNAERTILELEKKSGSNSDKYIARCIDAQIVTSFDTVVNSQILLDLKRETVTYTIMLYENITDEQRYNVKNYHKLEEIINHLKRLEEIEYNKGLANEVIKIINLLPDNITLSDEKQINEALEVYESLNDEAKEYVTNFKVLDEALLTIENIKQAMIVVNKIDELNTDVTLSDKEEIEIVNEMYNELNNDEKEYVTNYAKLADINSLINELIKDEMDKKSAKNVDNQIILTHTIIFDENIFLDIKKEQFTGCMLLYDNLSVKQKSYLENEDLLEEIRLHLEELELLSNKKSKAMYVYNLINEIPYHITIEAGESLRFVKNEYDKLDDIESSYVTNVKVLDNSLEVYELKLKADKIIKLINSLDIEFNSDYVYDAERYYLSLDNETKKYVTNYDKLSSYLKNIKTLEFNVGKAKDLNIEIENFELKSLKDEYKVLLFRSTYEDLLDNTKSYVTNFDNLLLMEKQILKMKHAKEIDELIVLLSNEEIEKNIKNIFTLFYDYQNLDSETKAYLDNGELLQTIYNSALEINDQVEEVIKAINQIGTVTIDEGDDIARCRLLYELLDDSMQVLVTNYETLLDVERDFIRLHSNFEENKGMVNTYIDEQILLIEELINDDGIDLEKKQEYIMIIKKSYEKLEDKSSIKYYEKMEMLEKRMVS